jgi:hypothetical protein
MTAEPATAARHTAIYPGRADQLRHVRRAVASHLAGCAATADAVLVASELAANANAPRGALLYPRCSRGELKGGSRA